MCWHCTSAPACAWSGTSCTTTATTPRGSPTARRSRLALGTWPDGVVPPKIHYSTPKTAMEEKKVPQGPPARGDPLRAAAAARARRHGRPDRLRGLPCAARPRGCASTSCSRPRPRTSRSCACASSSRSGVSSSAEDREAPARDADRVGGDDGLGLERMTGVRPGHQPVPGLPVARPSRRRRRPRGARARAAPGGRESRDAGAKTPRAAAVVRLCLRQGHRSRLSRALRRSRIRAGYGTQPGNPGSAP